MSHITETLLGEPIIKVSQDMIVKRMHDRLLVDYCHIAALCTEPFQAMKRDHVRDILGIRIDRLSYASRGCDDDFTQKRRLDDWKPSICIGTTEEILSPRIRIKIKPLIACIAGIF